MLALIKGVVDVGVVLSLKPILKSWQLCLSFKLDVLTTSAPTTERNIDHDLWSVSLILLYMYLKLIPYNINCIIVIKSFIINKVDYNNSYMYVSI